MSAGIIHIMTICSGALIINTIIECLEANVPVHTVHP